MVRDEFPGRPDGTERAAWGSVPAELAGLARRIDERLATLDAQLAELRADRAADSADDEHDPEGVTLSTEWSRIAGLRDDAMRERTAVADAQARVAAGTYGVCLGCGSPIAAGRLEALPTATFCIACASRL